MTTTKIDCPICIETTIPVFCQKCRYACCAKCIQRYLLDLTTVDPKCMNCKESWSMEVIHKNFSTEFYDKTFRNHRAKILYEREQSLLPETQLIIQAEVERVKMGEQVKYLKQKKTTKREKITKLNSRVRQLRAKIFDSDSSVEKKKFRTEVKEITTVLKEKREQLKQIHKKFVETKHAFDHFYPNKAKEEKVKPSFTTRCSKPSCNGYVFKADDGITKCGLCETVFCGKCLVKIDSDEHVCDEDTKKTIDVLKKETRSCPKCKILIYKISGCDQMYCTSCHTAFSWLSGQIETGRVHNPHYYEYQRNVNGQVEREAGDVGGCQANMYNLQKIFFYDEKSCTTLLTIDRLTGHVRHLCRTLFQQPDANQNLELRLRYLKNKIDKTQFIRILKMRDKKQEKYQSFRMILAMFADVAESLLKKLELSSVENPGKCIEFLDETLVSAFNLQKYTNNVLRDIELRFKNKVPYINSDFSMDAYYRWAY